MLILELSIIAKKVKHAVFSSANECINKMQHNHISECHSVTIKNEVLMCYNTNQSLKRYGMQKEATKKRLVAIVHACNSIYLGGRDRRIMV
jgi:hypothetical protein